jgi:hypothetical protein
MGTRPRLVTTKVAARSAKRSSRVTVNSLTPSDQRCLRAALLLRARFLRSMRGCIGRSSRS